MEKQSKKQLLRTLKSTYVMAKELSHFVKFENRCMYWFRDIAYYSLWLQTVNKVRRDDMMFTAGRIIGLYNEINNVYLNS